MDVARGMRIRPWGIISDGQIHIPVRLLRRHLSHRGFPILHDQIRWIPPQYTSKRARSLKFLRPLHLDFLHDVLNDAQIHIVRASLCAVHASTMENKNVQELTNADVRT